MDFQRYDDFAGNAKQKKIDKLLKKCPFCGENPHWLLKLEYGKTTLTCKCEKCGGELYAENYNLNSQSVMIAISTGKSNSNNLELNSSYSILYLATLQNINEEKELSALKERIISLYQEGKTMAEIQNDLRLSSDYLNSIVAKMKSCGEWSKAARVSKKDRIAKAIYEGVTDTERLCEMFEITESTLRTYKSQIGIKTDYHHCDIMKGNAQNSDEEKELSTLKERIIELHLQGMYLPQIQKKLSLSSAYLNYIVTQLKRNGEWPKVDRTLKKEEIAKAIAEGMTSTVELCETFGITEQTLKTYKSQMGIKTGRPKRNYRHCDRTNAIYEDLKAGVLTTAEIARKHGVKWQSVHKLRKKLEEDCNDKIQ